MLKFLTLSFQYGYFLMVELDNVNWKGKLSKSISRKKAIIVFGTVETLFIFSIYCLICDFIFHIKAKNAFPLPGVLVYSLVLWQINELFLGSDAKVDCYRSEIKKMGYENTDKVELVFISDRFKRGDNSYYL